MNIIVVGCGKVGSTLAEQLLNENHNVTIIDPDEKALRHTMEHMDVMGITGNGAVLSVLQDAGVEHADILIAATDSDEVNMLSCLIAKKSGNCSTIARIRDPEYYQEVSYLRNELGLAMVFNPERSAAAEIERLLSFPSAMRIDSFFKGKLEMIRVRVPQDSKIAQLQVYEISTILHLNVLICAIERAEQVIIPMGNTSIQAGDTISFMARPEDAYAFFRELGVQYTPVHTCMIVGGGRVPYYVGKYIQEMKLKIRLKFIEINPERCEMLADQFPEATVINGDGTDQELLLREGIEKTDAFCAMTGLDEENIMLSLYANKNSGARVITKVNHIAFHDVISDMPLGSVIYPKQLAADSIVQYVRAFQNSMGSNVETLYKIADGNAEALEFRVVNDPDIVEHPFRTMHFKPNVLIGAIIRDQEIITPGGSDFLLPNDQVIVITTNSGFNDLHDILA